MLLLQAVHVAVHGWRRDVGRGAGRGHVMMMCYKPRLVGPYGPDGSRSTAQVLKKAPL
jgi:hypothetical protein